MPYNCQYCRRQIKSKPSLERHEATCKETPANKGKPDTQPDVSQKPAGDAEGEELVVTPPEGKDDPVYECSECGHAIRQGDSECPECGEELNWEGIG